MEEIRKKYPYFFLIIIALIIVYIYVSFQIILVLKLHPWANAPTYIFMIIANIIFILLVWSIIMALSKDPGKVPLQWVLLKLCRDLILIIRQENIV